MILKGGTNISGIPIGILCLETYYARPPGHLRNASTFRFPVLYRIVKGATAKRVVKESDPELLNPFIEAARELEREGVMAITGSCGFLALFQDQLADSVDIPLFSSSLIQIPMVHRMLRRNRKVGILTASKSTLTVAHLKAVGAEAVPVCVAGMDDRLIGEPSLTVGLAQQMLPAAGLECRPVHERKISVATRCNRLAHQGGFQGKGARAAHGVKQRPPAVVAGHHQNGRRQGFAQRRLGPVLFDAPFV